ncbi:hypothetical protein H7E67_17265 [Clostridium gasigenes]|uniref:HD domain-containing protein n=1 Tax=Clostridium gasigenes TaxID=94869 RepID=UPI001624F95B|nr:hypothetical protein [Clostridium gasigenes]MBB6625167.1 hypothetical protein [Clostridium gasigenes]
MNITLESHLKEVSKEDGNKLYSNWMVIKEELCSKLETVSSYFQHFSLHNATHSNEICNNIERFLGAERIKMLSATDTWLLLMAFYSHDVGMALKYDDIVNTFEEKKFKEELKELINGNNVDIKEAAERVLAFEKENDNLKPVKGKALDIFRDVQLIIEEHYRKGHATRSANYIEKFLDGKYSMINSRMIELLKKICLSHQEDINNIEQLHYEENGLFQDYVHPRFVAGMLCLGDLLDMDTNRFSKYGLEAASTLAYESKLHLEKHRALKHFLIKPSGIEIEMDSPFMEVHRVARDWVQWIDETIDYLTLKWSCIAPKGFGNPPKITYKKLLIKGRDLFNEYADLKFTIDQSKALELLQGANIYKDKFVCIREVIQNAVDSSLIQLWKDINIEKKKKTLEEINECNKICNETLKYSKVKEYNSETIAIINFWEKLKIDKEYEEKIYENIKKFEEYPIDVCIYIDDKERVTIEVSDKGPGISNRALESMAKIGAKKDKRTDKDVIKSMPGWMKPSGQFGLGLQSIFLIADKFEMITKCNDEPGKRIVFESGKNNKGYITVEANDKNERGTTVRVCIDESKISVSDIKIDELSLKLKPKYEWIMEFIIEKAKKNQFIGESNNNKYISNIEMKNYFKIDINKDINNKEKVITNEYFFSDKDLIKCLSENEELIIIEENESLSYRYFDREFNCLCEVNFVKPIIYEKEGNKIIGYYDDGDARSLIDGGIYFKNVFVCNLSNVIRRKTAKDIFKYFNLSLNMLDNKADNLLEISRNSIKDNYKNKFYKILMNVLKKFFQNMHNYILKNGISSKNEYLIIIYQILRDLEIDTYEFQNKYQKSLEEFLYERGIYANDKIGGGFTFAEISSNTLKMLYPIEGYNIGHREIKKEYLELIDKNVIQEISNEDIAHQEIEYNKYFVGGRFYGNSIISYNVKTIKIGLLNNKFYYIDEFEPLIISPMQLLTEYDDINLINEFINVTKEKQREIIALGNFGSLVIENVIKLPFKDEQYAEVSESIKENKTEYFDKNAFKKDVISTEYFNYLVEYVSNKKNLSSDSVRQSYNVFIDKYLTLLINLEENSNPYKKFIKSILCKTS